MHRREHKGREDDPVGVVVLSILNEGANMVDHVKDVTIAELRNFGLIVGGIFLAIAFWPAVVRAEEFRLWALITAIVLVVPALTFPGSLRSIHKTWMRIGAALGWINTRIILGITYYVVLTPMGLIMRLFGWDAMRRALRSSEPTYRITRVERPRTHMLRQY